MSSKIEHMFDDVPGAASAAVLAGVVPADLDDADLVDAMRGWERLASWVAAGQLATIAELARRRPRDWVERGPGRIDRGDPRVPEITEFAVDEVAAALRLTGLAAGVRLQLAVELAGRLPGTAAALRAGRLDVPRARVIADGVAALEDRLATAVEERVLARAGDQTTGQLRVTLARVVLAADPSAAEARHERAVAERQVTVRPLPDGMAGLWALLPADGATALYARLDHVARGGPAGDPRPMDARRADALLALALGAVAPGAGVPTTSVPTTAASAAPTAAHSVPTTAATSAPVLVGASVRVTVRAETALGLADEPGHLAGHGPVPAGMARRLAGHGDWRRVLTDPVTGVVVDLGRTAYTPTAALADLVRTRDATWRFPGCRQPAHRCDLDHVLPWPAGPTTAANLAALCRHHHRLKHQSRWTVRPGPAGDLTWTSPTGHEYTTAPADP